ncbi:MAG: polysulfide reductase NrfD [Gemmatimonadetes bacterium]|nr:polysulfide reductase NrfD [Gemmatimonadota bacterium]
MNTRVRMLKDVLWALALAGFVAGVFRLWFGLGATTNLSDAVPWGLWKILNMVAGVAISTSGFSMGFLVYVLGLERYRPLMKPAILVAFLGYGCSCLALLFDIGLPWRFWHPFLMWNEHSFLFEVFWCVTLYFTVTAIELAPTVFEKLKAEKATRLLHRITFWVVIVGISLSSLHHSSLGSLFLVTPQRLHPLWYSALLPLLFILSAMGGGLMFLVLVRILHAHWYDRKAVFGPTQLERELILVRSRSLADSVNAREVGRDMPMLTGVARVATGILSLYLALEIYHLGHAEAWSALLAGTWESWLFGTELLITAVIPILLVWLPAFRSSPTALTVAALSASAGLLLNRVDVGIFGYFRSAGEVYFPSLAEWALSLGVVAAAALVFLAFVEHAAVFSPPPGTNAVRRGVDVSFDSLSRVWHTALSSGPERTTLIAVLVVPLAWACMYPPYSSTHPAEVREASRMDVTGERLRLDGDRGGVLTEFPHAACQKRLGSDSSCVSCHHMSLPGDTTTPCARCHRHMTEETLIFDHAYHIQAVADSLGLEGARGSNQTCVSCHAAESARTTATAKACVECHGEWTKVYAEGSKDLARATSYLEAMHGTCLACHEDEAEKRNRPELRECSTCHTSLTPLGAPGPVLARRQ